MKKYELLTVLGFLSPYGVAFILTRDLNQVFEMLQGLKFPSSYGVLFILIDIMSTLNDKLNQVLLSPYGISFILILWLKKSFITICF